MKLDTVSRDASRCCGCILILPALHSGLRFEFRLSFPSTPPRRHRRSIKLDSPTVSASELNVKINNFWIRHRIIHIDYRIFANNEIRVTKRMLVCLIHQWFLSSPYKGSSWLHLIVWLRYEPILCTFQHRLVQAFYDAQHTVFISHSTLSDYYVVQ